MKLKLLHRKIIFLFFLSISSLSESQGERDYWYFGQMAGMKFNGENIQSLSNNTIERRIVFGIIEGPDNLICANNEDGELMFYSDGRIFKNSLHQNMLNAPTNEYSVYYAQAAISRDPGNQNKYYVFVNIQDGLDSFLTYTVVDMTLDGGLGGLDPDNTHVTMINDVAQQMVVARHANGKDSWIICVRRGRYYAYLITENGIASTPVVSSAGVSIFDGNFADFGTLTISQNNKLIAAAFPGLSKLFLLEFNDLTGRISLAYEYEDIDDTFSDNPNGAVEFSNNNNVLYHSGNSSGIKQFNISDLNNIPSPIFITSSGNYPYLKLGPNGKIYSSQNGETFIGAIQEPDIIGLECDYDSNVLNLSGSQLLDLPVFLQPKFPEGISFINICEGETTEINFAGTFRETVRIEWDLGDGNTAIGENINHTFLNPGTYSVTAYVINEDDDEIIFTDTKEIIIYESPILQQPDDLYLCLEDTTIFFADYNDVIVSNFNPAIYSIKYYFSESDALLRSNDVLEYIPEIGTKTIWVRIENKLNPLCYDILSFDIITPEYIVIDMPTEQYICDERAGLTLSAPDGFISYEWSNGAMTQSININSTGLYTLTVVKDFGDFTCEARTTISVGNGDELPIIEDIKVIDWSRNHNSIEVVIDRIGNYEYSVDGVNFQESNVFLNLPFKEDYRVYVRDINCQQTIESDKLFLLYHDRFFTPNGDGVNDYWRVINNFREENIQIQIFNRYGRLLETMSYYDRGWDGTSDGVEMPTSDYWFRVVRQNGKIHYGHFTLKR